MRSHKSMGWLLVVCAALAALLVGLSTAGGAGAPETSGPGNRLDRGGRPQAEPGVVEKAERKNRKNARPALSKRAGPELVKRGKKERLELTPCSDDDTFLCGTLQVPLNRSSKKDKRTIGIHVEVLPHSGDRAEEGAIFATAGGPGDSITQTGEKYGFAFWILTGLTETRDLVFIDQRGVGLSEAINCPNWQDGVGDPYVEAAACHDQLGDTASFFGTRDVADDEDDVRKALGYKQIDIVGGSYAGNDVATYAARYPKNVRTAVLSSPAVSAYADPFYPEVPRAMPRIVDSLCGDSPLCAAANPDPAGSLAWLAQRLRTNPVIGVGIDADGNSHHLTVTEAVVVDLIMTNRNGWFTNQGEIAQAAEALRNGDTKPLLRLAAENLPFAGGSPGDGGAPSEFSAGHNLARFCVDSPLPWDKNASPVTRQAQYAAAVNAQPAFYGPFAKEAWLRPLPFNYFPDPCIASQWRDTPPFPAGTKVKKVPALLLHGEYDLVVPTEEGVRAAALFENSTSVEIASAGHNPWWWTECGPQLVERFIRTMDVGDTSCAAEVLPAWVPGSFPLTASAAPKANPASADDTTTSLEKRVITAGVWSLFDGARRAVSVASFDSDTLTSQSVGLRGGTIHRSFDPDTGSGTYEIDDLRFTNDVGITGDLIWNGDNNMDGDLTITGPGRLTGTLHVEGAFFVVGATTLKVTGTIGGHTVDVTVPAT